MANRKIDPFVLYAFVKQPLAFYLNFQTGEYQFGFTARTDEDARRFIPKGLTANCLYSPARFSMGMDFQDAVDYVLENYSVHAPGNRRSGVG